MAYLYGRAAMAAAGLTVLCMAGTAQAQEYEIRGCRPDLDLSACCPNLYDFPPGTALLSNGRVCRLDTARNRDALSRDVLSTGSIPGAVVGIQGMSPPSRDAVGTVGPSRPGGTGGIGTGSGTGGTGAGGSGGVDMGNNGQGHGRDHQKDNNGIGNGWEAADFDQARAEGTSIPSDTSRGDPDNTHGQGADKGGGKGGGKDKH